MANFTLFINVLFSHDKQCLICKVHYSGMGVFLAAAGHSWGSNMGAGGSSPSDDHGSSKTDKHKDKQKMNGEENDHVTEDTLQVLQCGHWMGRMQASKVMAFGSP